VKAKRKRIVLKEVLKRELKDPEFCAFFQREKFVSEIARLRRITTQKSHGSIR